jgi:nitrate reductase NapE component
MIRDWKEMKHVDAECIASRDIDTPLFAVFAFCELPVLSVEVFGNV